MLVINYYFSKDGKAFETEADRKSYERTKNESKYTKLVTSVWQKASWPKAELPGDKLTVFRGGYTSNGVYRANDFFHEDDAREYESFSCDVEYKWRDYMKYAMPEDLISYFDEMYLTELPSSGWTMWGTELPMPGTELTLLEKYGRGCTITYDVFDGENFVRAYHLDVLAWKLKSKDDPPNDPWEYYSSRRKLKKLEFTLYKRIKNK